MGDRPWKQYENTGIEEKSKAGHETNPEDKRKHLNKAAELLGTAYKLAEGDPYALSIATLCAKIHDDLAISLQELRCDGNEIGAEYKSAIMYYDLVLRKRMQMTSDQHYTYLVNTTVDKYSPCLKRALEMALSVGEKKGAWLVESYLEVIKEHESYPQMRYHCFVYIARIWKKEAHRLLMDWKFAKAMGMLRHARQAMETAKELSAKLKCSERKGLEKVQSDIENWFAVAKAMQKIDNAKILLEELKVSDMDQNVEIAHEVIDLFRSAVTLAEGKHTSAMKKALKGIGAVYRDVLKDRCQAQVYFNKAVELPARERP